MNLHGRDWSRKTPSCKFRVELSALHSRMLFGFSSGIPISFEFCHCLFPARDIAAVDRTPWQFRNSPKPRAILRGVGCIENAPDDFAFGRRADELRHQLC